MTIRLEVTGESMAEFKANFAALIGTFLPLVMQPKPEAPKVEEPKPLEGEVIPPKKDKKKAEPKQVDIEEKIAETPSVEELREKLKALGAVSHELVFELLGKHGAKNASTVPPEKRAEVIAAVDAKLKEKAE